MLLKIMLKRVQAHTSTSETQQVSMTGNFALDCTSLANLVINMLKHCQKSATDCVATFVAAQEVGFDLCEIVDGTPQGIDTLIRHLRGKVFSHDGARIQRIFPTILPTWRTLVQTKRCEHQAVCLAATVLLDTPDSDGPSRTSQ